MIILSCDNTEYVDSMNNLGCFGEIPPASGQINLPLCSLKYRILLIRRIYNFIWSTLDRVGRVSSPAFVTSGPSGQVRGLAGDRCGDE